MQALVHWTQNVEGLGRSGNILLTITPNQTNVPCCNILVKKCNFPFLPIYINRARLLNNILKACNLPNRIDKITFQNNTLSVIFTFRT